MEKELTVFFSSFNLFHAGWHPLDSVGTCSRRGFTVHLKLGFIKIKNNTSASGSFSTLMTLSRVQPRLYIADEVDFFGRGRCAEAS